MVYTYIDPYIMRYSYFEDLGGKPRSKPVSQENFTEKSTSSRILVLPRITARSIIFFNSRILPG